MFKTILCVVALVIIAFLLTFLEKPLNLEELKEPAVEITQLSSTDPLRCYPEGMKIIRENSDQKVNKPIYLQCSINEEAISFSADTGEHLYLSKTKMLLVEETYDSTTKLYYFGKFCLDVELNNGGIYAMTCRTKEFSSQFIYLGFCHITIIYFFGICVWTFYKYYKYFLGQNPLNLFIVVNFLRYFQCILSIHVELDTYAFKIVIICLNYISLLMICRQRFFNFLPCHYCKQFKLFKFVFGVDQLPEPIPKVMDKILLIQMVYSAHLILVWFNPALDFDNIVILIGISTFCPFMFYILNTHEKSSILMQHVWDIPHQQDPQM